MPPPSALRVSRLRPRHADADQSGPNLTYAGSLATLLWRRLLAERDLDTDLGEFARLGLLTVPAALANAPAASRTCRTAAHSSGRTRRIPAPFSVPMLPPAGARQAQPDSPVATLRDPNKIKN